MSIFSLILASVGGVLLFYIGIIRKKPNQSDLLFQAPPFPEAVVVTISNTFILLKTEFPRGSKPGSPSGACLWKFPKPADLVCVEGEKVWFIPKRFDLEFTLELEVTTEPQTFELFQKRVEECLLGVNAEYKKNIQESISLN